MHINHLPRLVFRLIFSKLSFADLLKVGRVCLLWRDYQALITDSVKCVTLLIGSESGTVANKPYKFCTPLDLIKRSPFFIAHLDELQAEDGSPLFAPQLGPDWCRLCIANLDLSTVHSLMKALANVTTLNVSINSSHSSVIDLLILLLDNWKHHLSTFKLWCHFYANISPKGNSKLLSSTVKLTTDRVHKLLLSLNSLPNLDHLTLDIDEGAQCVSNLANDELVFLFRVREFYFQFHASDASSAFYRWFRENDHSNTQLKHVGFGTCPKRLVKIKNLQLANKITVLAGPLFSIPPDTFWADLASFPSLTTLVIQFEQPFPVVINKLATFNQLIYLCIMSPNSNEAIVSMSSWDHIAQQELAKLPSVKILYLALNITHHSDLESSHWAWIFPNVQVLTVDHQCYFGHQANVTCKHYNYDQWHNLSQQHVTSCSRDLLATFKQCPKLRRIYLNESNIASEFSYKFEFKFIM